jgi:hypothetical protein
MAAKNRIAGPCPARRKTALDERIVEALALLVWSGLRHGELPRGTAHGLKRNSR